MNYPFVFATPQLWLYAQPILKVLVVQAKRVQTLGGKKLKHAFKTTDLAMTHRRKNKTEISGFSDQARKIREWYVKNKSAVKRILLSTAGGRMPADNAEVNVWTPINHNLMLGKTSVWEMFSARLKDG